jgi:hypothetical protein
VEFATELLDEASATAEPAPLDFETVVAEEGPESLSLARGRTYVDRLGAGLAAFSKGHGFVNGKHLDMDDVSYLPSLESF